MINDQTIDVLLDVGTATLLWYPNNPLWISKRPEAAIFAQRHILDTRVSTYNSFVWERMFSHRLGDPLQHKKMVSNRVEITEPDLIVIEKAKRAKILCEGYSFLLWYANLSTHTYSSTASIGFDDIPLYSLSPDRYILQFAKSKNLSYDIAKKQIDFDLQQLQSLALRRKEILWSYSETLLQVPDDAALELWQNNIISDTVTVGQL